MPTAVGGWAGTEDFLSLVSHLLLPPPPGQQRRGRGRVPLPGPADPAEADAEAGAADRVVAGGRAGAVQLAHERGGDGAMVARVVAAHPDETPARVRRARRPHLIKVEVET